MYCWGPGCRVPACPPARRLQEVTSLEVNVADPENFGGSQSRTCTYPNPVATNSPQVTSIHISIYMHTYLHVYNIYLHMYICIYVVGPTVFLETNPGEPKVLREDLRRLQLDKSPGSSLVALPRHFEGDPKSRSP